MFAIKYTHRKLCCQNTLTFLAHLQLLSPLVDRPLAMASPSELARVVTDPRAMLAMADKVHHVTFIWAVEGFIFFSQDMLGGTGRSTIPTQNFFTAAFFAGWQEGVPPALAALLKLPLPLPPRNRPVSKVSSISGYSRRGLACPVLL